MEAAPAIRESCQAGATNSPNGKRLAADRLAEQGPGLSDRHRYLSEVVDGGGLQAGHELVEAGELDLAALYEGGYRLVGSVGTRQGRLGQLTTHDQQIVGDALQGPPLPAALGPYLARQVVEPVQAGCLAGLKEYASDVELGLSDRYRHVDDVRAVNQLTLVGVAAR